MYKPCHVWLAYHVKIADSMLGYVNLACSHGDSASLPPNQDGNINCSRYQEKEREGIEMITVSTLVSIHKASSLFSFHPELAPRETLFGIKTSGL